MSTSGDIMSTSGDLQYIGGIACKVSNKSNERLLRHCTFIFSLSCSIASVTSYLSENEA